jgi:hypothetical protein
MLTVTGTMELLHLAVTVWLVATVKAIGPLASILETANAVAKKTQEVLGATVGLKQMDTSIGRPTGENFNSTHL